MMRAGAGVVIVEAVVILAILGLLSFVAVPKYWDTKAERRKITERSMAAAIRSEIFAYHVEVMNRAKQLGGNCDVLQSELRAHCQEAVKQQRPPCEFLPNTTPTCWPMALDQAGIGAQTGLFSFVLRSAATRAEDGWVLVAPGTYRGTYGGLWTYNGSQGTFLCRGWCP